MTNWWSNCFRKSNNKMLFLTVIIIQNKSRGRVTTTGVTVTKMAGSHLSIKFMSHYVDKKCPSLPIAL